MATNWKHLEGSLYYGRGGKHNCYYRVSPNRYSPDSKSRYFATRKEAEDYIRKRDSGPSVTYDSHKAEIMKQIHVYYHLGQDNLPYNSLTRWSGNCHIKANTKLSESGSYVPLESGKLVLCRRKRISYVLKNNSFPKYIWHKKWRSK